MYYISNVSNPLHLQCKLSINHPTLTSTHTHTHTMFTSYKHNISAPLSLPSPLIIFTSYKHNVCNGMLFLHQFGIRVYDGRPILCDQTALCESLLCPHYLEHILVCWNYYSNYESKVRVIVATFEEPIKSVLIITNALSVLQALRSNNHPK